MAFVFHFSYNHEVFCTQIRIVDAQRNRAAIVNRRVSTDDLFHVLRINVLASQDQQVFLPANDIQFTVQQKPQVASVVPAITDNFVGEIGAVVVALEQTNRFE